MIVHGKPSSLAQAEETARACLAAGGDASIVLRDISTQDGCEALAAQLPPGSLDLLVHNVGIYPRGSALETSPEALSETLRTNLEAPWHLTRLLVPRMEAGGSIVAMGYAGIQNIAATRHATAYLVSKTGLLVLVRSLALELAPARHPRQHGLAGPAGELRRPPRERRVARPHGTRRNHPRRS